MRIFKNLEEIWKTLKKNNLKKRVATLKVIKIFINLKMFTQV